MSQIAIFGGSFNPPHIGHQALCYMLLETCTVDSILIVPTYRHAFGKELVNFEKRVAMCRLMSKPLGDSVRVDEVEASLPNPQGRMLDTILALKKRNPDAQFRLVVGADILLETEDWHRWDEVTRLAPPLVFGRVGYEDGELPAPPEVSSSQIRSLLKQGKSALPWIPNTVQDFIDTHRLYQ